jgi:hypothetical protein
MHYFPCSGGPSAVSMKSSLGHITLNLCFCIRLGSARHVVHSVAFGPRNVSALFFLLGWAWCSFRKKPARTHYAELVFLHLVGSAGHIAHSGAFGCETLMHYFSCLGGKGLVSLKNVLGCVTLSFCFCIRWDLRVTLCIMVYET